MCHAYGPWHAVEYARYVTLLEGKLRASLNRDRLLQRHDEAVLKELRDLHSVPILPLTILGIITTPSVDILAFQGTLCIGDLQK